MREADVGLPDPEVPEADAIEQATLLEDEPDAPSELPEGADVGDAVEQSREVRLDEDEYR